MPGLSNGRAAKVREFKSMQSLLRRVYGMRAVLVILVIIFIVWAVLTDKWDKK
jgi:hypothetical protein